jgi:DNA-binding response OmpR family regulator
MSKILFVEDDANLCLLYASEFSDVGYEVATAQSGREAIELIDDDPPDLVVLDIKMEPMDGLELLDELLHRTKSLPVVINSAYPAFKSDFTTWGADAYIVKSSDLSELKEKVRDLLSAKVA